MYWHLLDTAADEWVFGNDVYKDERKIFEDAIKGGRSVLDAGCGPGRMIPYLLDKGLIVTAMDISQKMLDHVKADYGRHISTVLGDITKLPDYFERPFDYVTCLGGTMSGLLTRQEQDDFLHGVRSVLADDGVFFVDFSPAKEVLLTSYGSKIIKNNVDKGGGVGVIFPVKFSDGRVERGYQYFFSTREMESLLSNHGFSHEIFDVSVGKKWTKHQLAVCRPIRT